MLSKGFWKSKTFWANVATMAVAAGTGGLGAVTMIPGVSELAVYVASHPGVALGLVAGGNIALRGLTKGPIHILDPYLQAEE